MEHLRGTDVVVIDQSANSGYVELGIYEFSPGRGNVILDDNTGESTSLQRRIGVDALTSVPAANASCSRMRVVADTLNVRPIPSTAQRATGRIEAGEVVDRVRTVQGQNVNGNASWHRIVASGTAGYISARYVECL